MPSPENHLHASSADETTSLIANGPRKDDVETSNIHDSIQDDVKHLNATRESSCTSFKKEDDALSLWCIGCILSTSFAYGCIMTTLFLITLPVECQRIEDQHPTVPKSVRFVENRTHNKDDSMLLSVSLLSTIVFDALLILVGRLGLFCRHCWGDTTHFAVDRDAE
jgi:hypothetical protein